MGGTALQTVAWTLKPAERRSLSSFEPPLLWSSILPYVEPPSPVSLKLDWTQVDPAWTKVQ